MKTIIAIFFILFLSVKVSFCQIQATLDPTLTIENRDGFWIPFQHGYNTSFPMPGFEKQNRYTIDLAGTWKHQRFFASHDNSLLNRMSGGLNAIQREASNRYKPYPYYDDSGWEDFDLPMVENKMHFHRTPNCCTQAQTFDIVPELQNDESSFNGGVWYRKHFNVQSGTGTGYCKLIFYSVCYNCDVWLNGQYIGYHEGGYSSFSFDITDAINLDPDFENVLAIRVDNPPTYDQNQPTIDLRNDIIPCNHSNAWTNYTGIIHDVYIEFSNFISTVRADIVPQNLSGDIKTTVTIFNRHSLPTNHTSDVNLNMVLEVYKADVNSTNWMTDSASKLITSAFPLATTQNSITITELQTRVIQTIMNIPNPSLWFPAKTGVPFSNLYVLKVRLIDPVTGAELDDYYTQFGIRIIQNINHQTYINGEVSFLTGVGRVEDHPDKGRSVTHEIIQSDLIMIRDVFKCNWLRTATFPNDPYTYLLADRLGLAVMEEIPLFWFSSDAWQIQGGNTLVGRGIHYQMFREMFFRDYNRPCVFFWGTANENSVVCNDYENNFVANLKKEINLFNYPDGRFIVQAANSCNIFDNHKFCGQDPSQSTCDVAGWTMYTPCGGSQCSMSLGNFLDAEHVYLPTKSIFFS